MPKDSPGPHTLTARGVTGNSKKNQKIQFAEGPEFSPLDIPLSSNSVGNISLGHFHQEFPHFRWQLQEIKRTLIPGGYLEIRLPLKWRGIFPNPEWVAQKSGLFKKGVSHFFTLKEIQKISFDLDFPLETQNGGSFFYLKAMCHKPATQLSTSLPPYLHRFNASAYQARFPQKLGDAPRTPFNAKDFSGKNILVLSPHPDDEIIGCGGTLIKLRQAGAHITVILFTDGANSKALKGFSAQERSQLRVQESEKVAKSLGFSLKKWFVSQDELPSQISALAQKLRGLFQELNPAVIFMPVPGDPHPDHQCVVEILRQALTLFQPFQKSTSGGPIFMGYEVWTLSGANVYCIIDDVIEEKVEHILMYKLAMRVEDYIHRSLHNNHYHGILAQPRCLFAEGFRTFTANNFLESTSEHNMGKLTP